MTRSRVSTNLKLEHRIVRETVEALNIATERPVSARQLRDALPEDERSTLETSYDSPLLASIAKILRALERKNMLSSVKAGRCRLYHVPGTVPRGTCEAVKKPSRRRRVLALVRRTVEAHGRAVRAVDVVAHGEEEGMTAEVSAEMIKRDLTNLARTGELTVVDTVRGDGGGTNLYLPSDLDPSAYAPAAPLTWLEELKAAFDAVWQDRKRAAAVDNRAPVPPSTGDVRDRFRARHPEHSRLQDPRLLVNGMQQLAEGGQAYVRPVRRNGRRALLWAPVDVPDTDLDLGAAHASDSERLEEAVLRAMAALNVPAVTVRDVKDQVEIDPFLRPSSKQPIYLLLADVVRVTIDAGNGMRCERVQQRVVHAGLVEGAAYYTVPGTSGVEEYLELVRLKSEWPALCAEERLESLDRCALVGVRVGRANLLAAECRGIAGRAGAIADRLPFDTWTKEVKELAGHAGRCAEEAAAAVARSELNQLDLPNEPVQGDSGFTAHQFGLLVTPRYRLAGVDAPTSRLVPLLDSRIRRISNPQHVRRFSSDPSVAAEFLFERVEALIYAAFRWGDDDERYYANLAATTLGRLRDHRYVTTALQSPRFEERQVAVACLAFLGDPGGDLELVAHMDGDPVVRDSAQWGLNYVAIVARMEAA